MKAKCPSCSNRFEPSEAKHMRLVSGRLVAYCSERCKAEARYTPPPPTEDAAVIAAQPAPLAKPPPPMTHFGVVFSSAIGAAAGWILIDLLMRPAAPSAPPTATSQALQVGEPDRAQPEEPIAETARQILEEYFVSDDTTLRLRAAEALTHLGDSRGVGALRAILRQGGAPGRRATQALALHGDPEAVDLLRSALVSNKREQRWAAAIALARAGDKRVWGPLSSFLDKRRYRIGAAEALVQLGHLRARKILLQALESGNRALQVRAALALGRAGDRRARPVLIDLLNEDSFRPSAALALAHLGDPSAVDALATCLDHTAYRVEAAGMLAREGFSKVERLRVALATEPPAGRIAAALAVLLMESKG